MYGDGTQTNPYIPTAWDEFVYAVGKDKQTYVTMPEGGGVFDMNDIAPTGTSLNVVCKSLEGNDWEMRNAYNVAFNFNGDYNGGHAANLIHKFHFLNMYSDIGTLFYVNIGKLSECKISGIAAKNYALYRGEFERCSMNFKIIGNVQFHESYDDYWNNFDFVNAIVDKSESTSTSTENRIPGNNSLIKLIPNETSGTFNIRGKNNVFSSGAGNYVTLPSGTRVDVTEEQLKDAAYLRSIGFPIAGD